VLLWIGRESLLTYVADLHAPFSTLSPPSPSPSRPLLLRYTTVFVCALLLPPLLILLQHATTCGCPSIGLLRGCRQHFLLLLVHFFCFE